MVYISTITNGLASPNNNNGNGHAVITGPTLSRRLSGLTVSQRAAEAVLARRRGFVLVKPTNGQLAALHVVGTPTIWRADQMTSAELMRVRYAYPARYIHSSKSKQPSIIPVRDVELEMDPCVLFGHLS